MNGILLVKNVVYFLAFIPHWSLIRLIKRFYRIIRFGCIEIVSLPLNYDRFSLKGFYRQRLVATHVCNVEPDMIPDRRRNVEYDMHY